MIINAIIVRLRAIRISLETITFFFLFNGGGGIMII